jgi:hypothetical protein
MGNQVSQPKFNGRLLPPNDWEGDDFTPGAGGAYVTCQDTAAGRMLYYATNGDVDLDGKDIRAAIRPTDSDGVSFGQVSVAIQSLTSPVKILQWSTLTIPDIRNRLTAGLGLCVDGYYGAIPPEWREQRGGDFNHAIWVACYVAPNYRVWDPLNKDLAGYGKWIPATAIEPFMRSLSGLSGWINLDEIAPDAEGNPMMNLVPTTVHRVVDVPTGTILEKTPGGATHTTLKADTTFGLISATGTHYYIADGDYGVYVRRTKVTAVRTQDKNVGV